MDIEREFEDEDGNTVWWKMCEKEGCSAQVCLGLSDNYCYPHSAWWRLYKRYWNRLIDWLDLPISIIPTQEQKQ